MSDISVQYHRLMAIGYAILGTFLLHSFFALYFFLFYQKNPIVYSDPVEVSAQEVYAGDSVELLVKRCSKGNFTTTVVRKLIDSVVISFPDVTNVVSKGCVSEERRSVQLPKDLKPGIYYLQYSIIVPIRLLYLTRTDTVRVQTEAFEILAR